MSLASKDGEGRITGSGEGNRPFFAICRNNENSHFKFIGYFIVIFFTVYPYIRHYNFSDDPFT